MSSYFVDTNIFLRYYLKDDPNLSPKAQQIIDNCLTGKYNLTICSTTLLELVWTLKSFYHLPKNKILAFVDEILAMNNLHITDRTVAERTLSIFKKVSLDITDSYFAVLMEQEKITKIFSFDRDFDKIPGLKRLEKI